MSVFEPIQFSKGSRKKGFTLIELLVITAIICILSIGFASYLFQQNRLLNFSQKRDNMNQLMTGVVNASGNAEVLLQTENLQTP